MTSPLDRDLGRETALLHVTVVPGDLDASLAFYDAALAPLGLNRHSDFPDEEESEAPVEAVAYGSPDNEPVLWVITGTPPTSGLHIALAAPSRTAVDQFWRAGLAAGGRPHQAPRSSEIYRREHFGATLIDPDGNLIEAVTPD
jgi:catechol 2,3-dioxygenase-like lactoylglutathione lyase family enzyme